MPTSFRQYAHLLLTYLKPQKSKVICLGAFVIASIVLRLLAPQIIGLFIDTATTSKNTAGLNTLALLFIAIIIASQLVTATANYLSESVSWTATNLLRADLVLHCLRLDLSFHKTHTPGELIERVDGDVVALHSFFSSFVFTVIGNSLLLIAILLVLSFQDWRFGLVLSLFTLATSLILWRVQGVAIPHLKAVRQVKAELSGFTEERLGSREDCNSSGARGYVLQKFSLLLQVYLHKQRMGSMMSRTFSSTLEISISLGIAALLYLGILLFMHAQVSIGRLYLALYYLNILTGNLVGIITQVDLLQSTIASIHRINELYHRQSKILDGAGPPLPHVPLPLRFDDVSFAYVEDRHVLQHISFELKPGQTLGIVGRTGSGKTTLGRLLFRAYDPDSGSISLGETDIRQLALNDLRTRIGVVTQDVQIIPASVRANLTWFDTTIPDADILSALTQLHLLPWFASLEHGLDTLIGSGNRDLSAGEAQLLAFARVFLQKPNLILLDEASSRLDPATELLIEAAVNRLLQGCTALVIAHRLQTLKHMDSILVLDNGRIQEYGNREALLASPTSHFSTLLKTTQGAALL